MSINLGKIEDKTINLSKHDAGLQNIRVVLWWNAPNSFPAYDLDVSLFTLGNTPTGPKLIGEEWFVFYNNEASPNGAIVKTPDARDNEGTEELQINISALPPQAEELSIIVTIHKGDVRKQTFGQIQDAGVKIINADTNEEIAFFDLDSNFGDETAVQIGSFYNAGGEFSFQAIGQGYKLLLDNFVEGYVDGVEIVHS